MTKQILTTLLNSRRIRQFSDHITKYLKDQGRDEQLQVCRKVNGWLFKLTGRNISGGTAIGKHYASLVLDINYNDGMIHIGENCSVSIMSKEIDNFKEFKAAIEEYYGLEQW